jgi:hypothetical protein
MDRDDIIQECHQSIGKDAIAEAVRLASEALLEKSTELPATPAAILKGCTMAYPSPMTLSALSPGWRAIRSSSALRIGVSPGVWGRRERRPSDLGLRLDPRRGAAGAGGWRAYRGALPDTGRLGSAGLGRPGVYPLPPGLRGPVPAPACRREVSVHADLIAQARHLCQKEPRRPQQARRGGAAPTPQ